MVSAMPRVVLSAPSAGHAKTAITGRVAAGAAAAGRPAAAAA